MDALFGSSNLSTDRREVKRETASRSEFMVMRCNPGCIWSISPRVSSSPNTSWLMARPASGDPRAHKSSCRIGRFLASMPSFTTQKAASPFAISTVRTGRSSTTAKFSRVRFSQDSRFDSGSSDWSSSLKVNCPATPGKNRRRRILEIRGTRDFNVRPCQSTCLAPHNGQC